MRSVARALTMKGSLCREDIEWHDGRHDLFDQLMDDCAGEMGEIDGGMILEGPDTAPPGGPGRGIPHLNLMEGMGSQPEAIDTAPPGIVEGEAVIPRTPENRGRRNPQWSSPAFGGPGGSGGLDPLQELDPWDGAVKKTKEYSTGAKQLQLRAGVPSGEPEGDDDGDDDGTGSRRDPGDGPEDLLSKFRKSMDQIGRDRPNSQRGGIHPGGGGGGGPGDDGGDDGHRSIVSSQRSQAGDD
eukprot:3058647-Amphidinium_carterae.1